MEIKIINNTEVLHRDTEGCMFDAQIQMQRHIAIHRMFSQDF